MTLIAARSFTGQQPILITFTNREDNKQPIGYAVCISVHIDALSLGSLMKKEINEHTKSK